MVRLVLQSSVEGVEEPEQAALLTAGGCDTAQGFLWSRPLPLSMPGRSWSHRRRAWWRMPGPFQPGEQEFRPVTFLARRWSVAGLLACLPLEVADAHG